MQPLLSSQDIFCEGMTIKSGETGTKRKVKSLASWPFLFQERSFKTFDQQTTVLRSVKEKPDKYVWLFAFWARVITERNKSYIQLNPL